MEENPIERIRNASFPHAVRGYDRREVDAFHAELADWLERGGEELAGSEAVRAALARVGEQTKEILTTAHSAAESIRDEAAAEVRQKLVDANATAERVRSSAEEYRDKVRGEADDYARRTRAKIDAAAEAASAEARTILEESRRDAEESGREIVDEANRRRREIETVIAGLEERREGTIAELRRLASEVAGAAGDPPGAPEAGAKPAEAAANGATDAEATESGEALEPGGDPDRNGADDLAPTSTLAEEPTRAIEEPEKAKRSA